MMFLELKGDGTFRLPYYQRNLAGDVKDKSLYEGEYHLDDSAEILIIKMKQ